ncbi:hypothetical protein Tco_0606620 [Tanacetum coccineum]
MQETQQVAARDEKWVSFTERVKTSSINIRLETTVPQKEEIFQVVIDLIKNSSCFKAFTISIDVPESLCSSSGRILIYVKSEGVNFMNVPMMILLSFLIKLGYKGPLYKHTNMFVDHMHQPWRTLAAIINKCLSGKTTSNDKLRRRRDQDVKICHFPDSPRLKFVRIGEDYQEYGLSIPKTMLIEAIKQSESYQMFIKYNTESEPEPEPVKRKTSSKRRVKKKVTLSADDNIISDDPDTALELGKSISKTEAEEAEAARQVHATHARIVTESVPEPTKRRKSSKVTSDPPKKLKGVPSLTLEEQEAEEDKLDDEEKNEKEVDAEDEDDETESDEDDIYKYRIRVRKDEDEELLNAKVKDSDKGDEEVTDAAKSRCEKAALKEYDQKSPLYQTMHINKSFNQNPANHRLYHALMEALIEDENAMDKGVADIVQDHKRKHDDDEDPLAGPNQGSKTGKSASAKEPVEEPIAEVVMNDVGDDVVRDDDQPQDASEPKTAKTPNPEWFTQPPRPPTPDPEWNKCQVVLDQPKQPWFNQMVSATKDPLTFNDFMATLIDFSKLDWNNPKGDRYPFDLSNLFPLQGHPGHLIVAADYFFNNDLKYLKSSNSERTYTTSITKTKVAWYEIEGIGDMILTLWSQELHGYGPFGKRLWCERELTEFYKFKEGDFVDLYLNDIEDMLLLVVQHKLFHITDNDIVDFIVALRMFARSLVIKKRVEDLQLGVESYKKKLNITPPQ